MRGKFLGANVLKENSSRFQRRSRDRGYPDNLLGNTLSEIKFSERMSALHNKQKTRKRILPFVTEYRSSVRLPNLKSSLMSKGHLIENQPLLREIYRDPPLLSYRRGRSFGNVLVRAKLLKVKVSYLGLILYICLLIQFATFCGSSTTPPRIRQRQRTVSCIVCFSKAFQKNFGDVVCNASSVIIEMNSVKVFPKSLYTSCFDCFLTYTMLHGVARCCTVLQAVTRYYTMLQADTPCYRLLVAVIRCYTLLHAAYTVLHAVTQCYTVLHGVTRCCTVLHGATSCCTLLPSVTSCYTVLQAVTRCLYSATQCNELLQCHTVLQAVTVLHVVTRCDKLLHDVARCNKLLHGVTGGYKPSHRCYGITWFIVTKW